MILLAIGAELLLELLLILIAVLLSILTYIAKGIRKDVTELEERMDDADDERTSLWGWAFGRKDADHDAGISGDVDELAEKASKKLQSIRNDLSALERDVEYLEDRVDDVDVSDNTCGAVADDDDDFT